MDSLSHSNAAETTKGGLSPSGELPALGWLSLAMGLGVANTFYCQALLPAMADSWKVSAAQVILVPAFSQWGLAMGLLLLVPLGDAMERRRLLVWAAVGSAVACALLALAPDLRLALPAAFLLGLFSLVTSLLPPFAARLTPPDRLGGVLGTLLAGQFTGLLLSRTLSGFLAQLQSWRLIYVLAAPMMGLIALWFHRYLPRQLPERVIPYWALQRSQLTLWSSFAELRRTCIRQGLLFGAFMAMWSALALHLAAAPFRFNSGQIGLFALVGVLSIAFAPVIGRLVDRYGTRSMLIQMGVLAVLALTLLRFGSGSIAVLAIGMACLDVAMQGTYVAHQTLLLSLNSEARNRILAWLMFTAYLGATLCTLLLTPLWARWQWQGATSLGLILVLLALLLAVLPLREPRRGD